MYMALPDHVDPREWIERWDRMQEACLVDRGERLDLIAELLAVSQPEDALVVDLGCGTGSLSHAVLERMPGATVVGIDVDPTLLPLAEARLEPYGERARVIQADLRQAGWPGQIGRGARGAVSATALHWLDRAELARVYRQAGGLLEPGGILLNADPVRSEHPDIHRYRAEWEHELLGESEAAWRSFWDGYLAVLGPDAARERQRALRAWRGDDEGYPLEWHFEAMRASGLGGLDCFWRRGPDAVIGGIKQPDAGGKDRARKRMKAKPTPAW
jgi:trans-aconitate methyltransferase